MGDDTMRPGEPSAGSAVDTVLTGPESPDVADVDPRDEYADDVAYPHAEIDDPRYPDESETPDPASGSTEVVQDAPAPTPAQQRVDFGAHLEANYRRLVAQLYAITLDPAEAHSVVQDAYSRAWRTWATVSRSPDSVGWVRRVAVRSTIRSWRRLRPRSRRPVGPGPETPPGAVLAALRQLPAAERRCVVLHHMAGAPVLEIAAVEGVSVGTIAARLARAQKVVSDGLVDLGKFNGDYAPSVDADYHAGCDAAYDAGWDTAGYGPDQPSEGFEAWTPDGDDPRRLADDEEDQR